VDLGLSPGAAISTVPAFILPWFDRPTLVDVGPSHLIWLLPLALVILVQTSGEDVFFKGYLLRQLGAATRVGGGRRSFSSHTPPS